MAPDYYNGLNRSNCFRFDSKRPFELTGRRAIKIHQHLVKYILPKRVTNGRIKYPQDNFFQDNSHPKNPTWINAHIIGTLMAADSVRQKIDKCTLEHQSLLSLNSFFLLCVKVHFEKFKFTFFVLININRSLAAR